jgi:hypothetical protein
MSPVVAEILQQIDRLPLLEQTKILRQLEQKIETATAHDATSPNSVSTSQQQWQQAIDNRRSNPKHLSLFVDARDWQDI